MYDFYIDALNFYRIHSFVYVTKLAEHMLTTGRWTVQDWDRELRMNDTISREDVRSVFMMMMRFVERYEFIQAYCASDALSHQNSNLHAEFEEDALAAVEAWLEEQGHDYDRLGPLFG